LVERTGDSSCRTTRYASLKRGVTTSSFFQRGEEEEEEDEEEEEGAAKKGPGGEERIGGVVEASWIWKGNWSNFWNISSKVEKIKLIESQFNFSSLDSCGKSGGSS